MGAGIAQVSIDKGYRVILKDTNQQGLSRGIGQIQNGLSTSYKKKKITRFVYIFNNWGLVSPYYLDTSYNFRMITLSICH